MRETAEEQWLRQFDEQGIEIVRARFMDRAQTGWGDGASINWVVAVVDNAGKTEKAHPTAKFVREWISNKDAERTREGMARHDQIIRLARVAAWASVVGVIISLIGLSVALV